MRHVFRNPKISSCNAPMGVARPRFSQELSRQLQPLVEFHFLRRLPALVSPQGWGQLLPAVVRKWTDMGDGWGAFEGNWRQCSCRWCQSWSVYFLAKRSTCVMAYAFGLFDAIAKNERLLVKKATMLLDECEASIEVWIMFLPVFCVAIKKLIGTAIFILV